MAARVQHRILESHGHKGQVRAGSNITDVFGTVEEAIAKINVMEVPNTTVSEFSKRVAHLTLKSYFRSLFKLVVMNQSAFIIHSQLPHTSYTHNCRIHTLRLHHNPLPILSRRAWADPSFLLPSLYSDYCLIWTLLTLPSPFLCPYKAIITIY